MKDLAIAFNFLKYHKNIIYFFNSLKKKRKNIYVKIDSEKIFKS